MLDSIVKVITGKVKIRGNTTGTLIGNSNDRLKVEAADEFTSKVLSGLMFGHVEVHVVGNGNSFYQLMITPASPIKIIFYFYVQSTGPGTASIYEDCTVSANGILTNIYNRERNSSNVSSMLVYYNPTVLTEGNLIEASSFGSTGGAKGGSSGGSSTIVLKANSKYLVKYTSAASNNAFSEQLFWYEGS